MSYDDHRVKQVHRVVSQRDWRLFAVRSHDGKIHVLREGVGPKDQDYPNYDYVKRPNPQFILALTDNWKMDGEIRDWGLLPIEMRLAAMDTWNRYSRPEDRLYEMYAERERIEKEKDRQRSNENRAIAMDMRKDFARATNDFVTRAGDVGETIRRE